MSIRNNRQLNSNIPLLRLATLPHWLYSYIPNAVVHVLACHRTVVAYPHTPK